MRQLALLTILVVMATPAAARDKELVVLCVPAATCSNGSVLHFGTNVRLEAAVDDDTGCPSNATYTIQGQNTGGVNWHDVTVLSTGGISSDSIDPSMWFPTWRAVPSDTTGCSSLEVNLWITRN